MPDTELTVSHPIVITVAVDGLDFNGVVAEIRRAAAQACGEILGCVLRAVKRRAQVREPDRWVNRGQATRRLRLPWGEVTVRRTRVRDRQTGRTYNLADRLLGLRPYVRRGVEEVRTACELAVTPQAGRGLGLEMQRPLPPVAAVKRRTVPGSRRPPRGADATSSP